MDSRLPIPPTFAARAAYFGERMCPFCDHRNPSGAKFCNDCGSPLYLKPCPRCSAINDQAATNCYTCGEDCMAFAAAPDATPLNPSFEDPEATVAGAAVAAKMKPGLFAGERLRVGWRLLAVGTILIAIVLAVRNLNPSPDTMGVAAGTADATQGGAPAAAPITSASPETRPAETGTAAALSPSIPVAATAPSQRASAYRRPAPTWESTRNASSPWSLPRATTRSRAVAATRKTRATPSSQAMQVSQARCSGDLFARMLCDQRVRQRMCERRWGETQECTGGVPSDHGQ